MTNSPLRNRDRARPGHPTQFTHKDHSDPVDTLAAPGRELADILLSPEVKSAATAAGAGGHNALFVTTRENEAELEQLVHAMAKAQGKHVVTVDGRDQVTSSTFIGARQPDGGSIAQAHGGILFIKNAPEMSASLLDALRQPMETGVLSVTRGDETVTRNADFQLVVTVPTSPCGLDDSRCICSAAEKRRYRGRLSGPLLDRMDMQVNAGELRHAPSGATSAEETERVAQAKAVQRVRLAETPWRENSEVSGSFLRSPEMRLPHDVTAKLDRSLEHGGITMRGYDRVLRVAWTLADLDGADKPSADHVLRAAQLRKA